MAIMQKSADCMDLVDHVDLVDVMGLVDCVDPVDHQSTGEIKINE